MGVGSVGAVVKGPMANHVSFVCCFDGVFAPVGFDGYDIIEGPVALLSVSGCSSVGKSWEPMLR